MGEIIQQPPTPRGRFAVKRRKRKVNEGNPNASAAIWFSGVCTVLSYSTFFNFMSAHLGCGTVERQYRRYRCTVTNAFPDSFESGMLGLSIVFAALTLVIIYLTLKKNPVQFPRWAPTVLVFLCVPLAIASAFFARL